MFQQSFQHKNLKIRLLNLFYELFIDFVKL